MDLSQAKQAAQQSLAGLREALIARHGATHLEVTVHPEGTPGGGLVLRGTVLVHALRTSVLGAVRKAVGEGCPIDATGIGVLTEAPWFEVPEGTPLVDRAPEAVGQALLCTQLRGDAVVQLLATSSGASLVRGGDGTVGWTTIELRPLAQAPLLTPPKSDDPDALVRTALVYEGVPYLLGGTANTGIDCSGLVQRACDAGLGMVVPRHSKDQLMLAPRPGAPPHSSGNLVFVWTASEALCHVGITAGETVVHASLSRRRVVRDNAAAFLSGSRRTYHVPFEELLAFGERVAGAPSLIAAGITLGAPIPADV